MKSGSGQHGERPIHIGVQFGLYTPNDPRRDQRRLTRVSERAYVSEFGCLYTLEWFQVIPTE